MLIQTGGEWRDPQASLPSSSEHFPVVVHEADPDFDAVTTQFYHVPSMPQNLVAGKRGRPGGKGPLLSTSAAGVLSPSTADDDGTGFDGRHGRYWWMWSKGST